MYTLPVNSHVQKITDFVSVATARSNGILQTSAYLVKTDSAHEICDLRHNQFTVVDEKSSRAL